MGLQTARAVDAYGTLAPALSRICARGIPQASCGQLLDSRHPRDHNQRYRFLRCGACRKPRCRAGFLSGQIATNDE